ncbi:unnamed protein product [Chrysodeixis includens]|uniref:Uncharacterized protein n=1 Tax=Chrysodeixis includens TaxID=689277 RepID=A0A9N8L6H7_CHRIL|nr:unnamed protein product [Chrysodeixis includens]
MPLDPRKTVFVGGVPRPLKAGESTVAPLTPACRSTRARPCSWAECRARSRLHAARPAQDRVRGRSAAPAQGCMPLDPRKTVFVGGVPRPLKAGESTVALLTPACRSTRARPCSWAECRARSRLVSPL